VAPAAAPGARRRVRHALLLLLRCRCRTTAAAAAHPTVTLDPSAQSTEP
jgi:hypothetical protein